ncbi:MAG: prohibitin family protein [Bacteroidales bacterium]|nr:prohibitin family protein [Bacteroidales bacterium]
MKKKQTAIIAAIVLVLLLIIFGGRMFHVIKPGERGLVFRNISGVLDKDKIRQTGLNVIAPWNNMYKYNVREQQRDEIMDVLDKSGLSISVDITVRFNPLYDRIGYLHEVFGRDFANTLIIPEVRSSVRKVMGRYTAEEIYSTKRNEVEMAIITETGKILDTNNIDMRALLIRSINLPAEIKGAIETKLTREQESLAMIFVLEKERQEADRKLIEAEGIANYNRTISASLTDRILTLRGIEATSKLAESANSKIVVVGSGENGLPLILGGN